MVGEVVVSVDALAVQYLKHAIARGKGAEHLRSNAEAHGDVVNSSNGEHQKMHRILECAYMRAADMVDS